MPAVRIGVLCLLELLAWSGILLRCVQKSCPACGSPGGPETVSPDRERTEIPSNSRTKAADGKSSKNRG